VKTHLQARANVEIAVGHQHEHTGGMAGALRTIFTSHGIRGLWRGVNGAMIRVAVGSATQLTLFAWTKEHIVMLQVYCHIVAVILVSISSRSSSLTDCCRNLQLII